MQLGTGGGKLLRPQLLSRLLHLLCCYSSSGTPISWTHEVLIPMSVIVHHHVAILEVPIAWKSTSQQENMLMYSGDLLDGHHSRWLSFVQLWDGPRNILAFSGT